MDRGTVKRVSIFAGHYGSGKTNVAVNYALYLREQGKAVSIADLDIVNPYFRTKDSEAILQEKGIRLISSPYANTNVDTPALPAEAYGVIHDRSVYSVVDVGGDDRGALALGRYASALKEEDNFSMYFVVNQNRYLTADPESALEVMREISAAAGLAFTGVVNNTNLGEETTAKTVLQSVDYAKEIAEKAGLPLVMTTAKESVAKELEGRIENLMPIRIYVKQSWIR